MILDSEITKEELNKLLFDNLKWRFALKASDIGIWDYDANTNRVHFSEESKKIVGYTDEEFGYNPQDWNNLVHPDDKEKYLQDFKDHLNGKTPIYENISRIKCKDGSYKWILDRGKILEKTDDGKEKRVIGVHFDITEHKLNEQALLDSISIVTKQNNKLKNFAHIASHNLKEHTGNFESLLSFYDEAETLDEKDDIIQHIKTVAISLSKTVNNLRDIVTIETKKSNKIEKLNLKDYVNDGIKILNVDILNTNAIVKNNVEKSIFVEFNSAYLQSIIQNLLSNAIKYRHPERIPVIDINAHEIKSDIVFSLTDNGLGIDLDKFGNDFFGLYRTFHQNKNSEGVGLYITKNQLESLGGSIKVSSKVDIGTKFTITIPKKNNPTE